MKAMDSHPGATRRRFYAQNLYRKHVDSYTYDIDILS